MTCEDVILRFLMQYLDRELPADLTAGFEAHLSLCPSCVNFLASYEDTFPLGRSRLSTDEAFAEEIPEELVQVVLSVQRS